MITREINNVGEPIRSPDGVPLGGVPVRFLLCEANGAPISALDLLSRERYLPTEITSITSPINTPDLKIGEFRVNLWPTSRGDRQLFYRCKVGNSTKGYIAPLVESATVLKWSDFINSGAELTVPEVSALAVHTQDAARHVSTADRARWDSRAGNASAMLDASGTGLYYTWVVSAGEAYLMEVAAGTSVSSVMTDLDGSGRQFRWVVDNGVAALEEL